MKLIKMTARIKFNEYNIIKQYAKLNHKTLNKVMSELVSGSLCLCPHHDLLNVGMQKQDNGDSEQLNKTLQFAYETLLLLREIAKLEHPELVNLATSKRLAYFDPTKDKNKD